MLLSSSSFFVVVVAVVVVVDITVIKCVHLSQLGAAAAYLR